MKRREERELQGFAIFAALQSSPSANKFRSEHFVDNDLRLVFEHTVKRWKGKEDGHEHLETWTKDLGIDASLGVTNGLAKRLEQIAEEHKLKETRIKLIAELFASKKEERPSG